MDNSNKPMVYRSVKGQTDVDQELNLANPYGKISCLILYIYTMEFGQPPLYYEINRICRTLDTTKLITLGPYVRALGYVTAFSEKNRDTDDKI